MRSWQGVKRVRNRSVRMGFDLARRSPRHREGMYGRSPRLAGEGLGERSNDRPKNEMSRALWVYRKTIGDTVAERRPELVEGPVEAPPFDKRSTELTPKSQGAQVTNTFPVYSRTFAGLTNSKNPCILIACDRRPDHGYSARFYFLLRSLSDLFRTSSELRPDPGMLATSRFRPMGWRMASQARPLIADRSGRLARPGLLTNDPPSIRSPDAPARHNPLRAWRERR